MVSFRTPFFYALKAMVFQQSLFSARSKQRSTRRMQHPYKTKQRLSQPQRWHTVFVVQDLRDGFLFARRSNRVVYSSNQ